MTLLKSKYPIVVWLVVLANILLYYLISPNNIEHYLTSPKELWTNASIAEVGKALLSGFLHINFEHLFSNMLLLVLLGYYVEQRIGHYNTGLLLVCAGLGAIVLHCLSNIYSPVPFLGASGYVFGILAAYCLII